MLMFVVNGHVSHEFMMSLGFRDEALIKGAEMTRIMDKKLPPEAGVVLTHELGDNELIELFKNKPTTKNDFAPITHKQVLKAAQVFGEASKEAFYELLHHEASE